MKRKGFTLVELLAVIAILAILVIIALPNVMGMFNQAKKNSFTTEIKEIYKVAEQQWISDSMFDTKERVYSRCDSGCSNPLDLTGRNELEYYIKFDKAGKVVEYYATDHTYQYSFSDTSGLKVENIDGAVAVADINENDEINISSSGVEVGPVTYIYTTGYGCRIGDTAPSANPSNYVYDNYLDAINTPVDIGVKEHFYVRSKVSNGIVTETALGFIYNNQPYYMIGLDENYYQTNKQNLLNNLPSDYCSVFTNEHYDENNNMSLVEYVGCVIPSENGFHEFYVEISEREGLVYASDYSRIAEWTCQVSRQWVNCLN